MNGNEKKQRALAKMHHGYVFLAFLLCISMIFATSARALNLTVEDASGVGITSYRWLIEEDRTYHIQYDTNGNPDPAAIDPNWRVGDPLRNTLSTSFHRSYMPVVATGNQDDIDTTGGIALDGTKPYFISVLSSEGHSLGGAQIAPGETSVTVYVNKNPIPTAQISILVHKDIAPINNVWDQGEPGLPGFTIVLEDAGGRWGISAGMQMLDVFGNPLCTTYNLDGTVKDMSSACVTGPDGRITIQNIAPGKYGIIAVPPISVEDPPDSGNFVATNWVQTSTLEGKKLIDAWVKANEPPFFAEFGPPGPHVSIGFAPAGPDNPYVDTDVLEGGATITGQVVNLHLSRPPGTAFFSGAPFSHTTPWVGLNMGVTGEGKGVFAKRANADGSFSIPNVPDGAYQLVIWDDYLDLIFAFKGVTITNGASVALGEVPVFQWFARTEHWVYNDENENGLRDPGEGGILEQAVNLRWRDGTIYQSFPTDGMGFVPFDEVFPFFSWLVAEVDFARFKATGLTVTVDDGGFIGPPEEGSGTNWGRQLTPQVQGVPFDPASETIMGNYRTELGPVLTQGFQGFIGQTSVFEWGKKAYLPGENGGISGIVYYAVTRAEDDPEMAGAEVWEPGIPNVTVELYGLGPDGLPNTLDDVLLNSTATDSWDDSLPADCQYGINAGSTTDDPYKFRDVNTDCFDGMRNWNQVRPGVFDGGYAFDSIIDPDTSLEISPIPPGMYVVKVTPPHGYMVIRSQDKNVDFGDEFGPVVPDLLPAQCIGTLYDVPDELALFPGVEAPLRTSLTGNQLNLCDSKMVPLSGGANAAADFFLFTEVPPAAHITGFILDDASNEFDPASPMFGEKFAPPFLPVSIRDWTGREIGRTVSDENGSYNALVPSTFTQNLGKPSGISPNMLTTCINAKTRADGSTDPLHDPQYSQFCYTFQYMPGVTTYLDTPVVPVAAFAGPDQSPLDCEFPDGTPRILSVTNAAGQGPYLAEGNGTITISSMGPTQVTNPAYAGVGGATPRNIIRDYGFGDGGSVNLVAADGISYSVTVPAWSGTTLTGTVSGVPEGAYQLMVTRNDNNKSTITGVTVQVGLRKRAAVRIVNGPSAPDAFPGAIQTAIDNAGRNDLILVAPGIYHEQVIMWKPVQLQGWGEGSTYIDAVKFPAEKLVAWRGKLESLVLNGDVDLLPGQVAGFGGIEQDALFSEEGAGVLVMAQKEGGYNFAKDSNQGARIDGFTISGADTGGGITVNGYVDFLEISNNRVINNTGFFGGGVRVGHPELTVKQDLNQGYTDADNDNVRIHHNQITQNGGLSGAGGGVSICTGSDNYEVAGNFVCGNFTMANGAGIAHYGLSKDGLIAGNTVLFNENFNQGSTVNGGGILISGKPPLLINPGLNLTPGSGSVQVLGNLIQGNGAGAGDGGGIKLSRINGQDVEVDVSDRGVKVSVDYKIDIVNNMIVDNVAALAGGGISLQDALDVKILHNTIAHNDNASVAGGAFPANSPSQSEAMPGAGIVSRGHSIELAAFLPAGAKAFSDPELFDNIIWKNRKFFFLSDASDPLNVLNGLCPDIGGDLGLVCPGGNAVVYDDLAVLPTGDFTQKGNNLITNGTDPQFMAEYFNGNRDSTIHIPESTTGIQAPPAFDEGGNFIRLRYGPLTQTIFDSDSGQWVLRGDYHIQAGSPAQNAGINVKITDDFDGEPRPNGDFDIGADEVQQ